ncbi:hypothetical protein Sm713_64750 [Streptomyces sp. TS71-3]|nr:hypothetical protein Sm713_64750 [Streptomyces sp. TS71-3]
MGPILAARTDGAKQRRAYGLVPAVQGGGARWGLSGRRGGRDGRSPAGRAGAGRAGAGRAGAGRAGAGRAGAAGAAGPPGRLDA